MFLGRLGAGEEYSRREEGFGRMLHLPHLLGGCVRFRALGRVEKVVKQHEQLRGGGDG